MTSRPRRLFQTAVLFSLTIASVSGAQDRIAGRVDSTRIRPLRGYVHPMARPDADQGPADSAMPISSGVLLLRPAAGLDAFLIRQQTPGSPEYRRWLTPDEFGARFGSSGNDTAKIVAWMESQGLRVENIARGGLWISFSGTAGSVGKAFRTEIHRYRAGGVTHYANATEPSIPLALDAVVAGVHGLNDFRPTPMVRTPLATPEFTSPSGSHTLGPDDIAAIYDIAPLYASGIDGTGQTIAVLGQTDINLADIRAFRQKFGLPPNDPRVLLFGKNPGTSQEDAVEANLDLEWAGAVARNATILYVNSSDVFLSLALAIDLNVAPVLSLSYSFGCEFENEQGFHPYSQQAAAQGMTWVVASGDTGAAGCDITSPTPQASKGKSISVPASLPEVTAIGGTTLNEGSGSYWNASNGPNGNSARTWIPEVTWNDSAQRNDLSATGGGASVFFTKPFWQSAPGVPDDGMRDVPDISFAASPDHDGYAIQTGGRPAIVGGTSVGTPIFAGVVALLNQYLVSQNAITQPGLGNVNPGLYRLAQSSTDVFHDITAGDNMVPCAQASPNCVNGMTGYMAGAGYDLATGLGSADIYHLVKEWTTGVSSTTTLTATPSDADVNDTVTLTATVTSPGTSRPTGTVTFLSSENVLGEVSLTPGTGSTATGSIGIPMVRIAENPGGTVQALYNGDGVVSGSGATTSVNLNIPAAGSLVIPSIDPNPVYQFGNAYFFGISFQEAAGVATKVTGQSFDGSAVLPLAISIPAYGAVFLSSGISGLQATAGTHTFTFSGVDGDGRKWSQSVSAIFLPSSAPAISPSILLTSVPSKVLQNPAADASCQWSQQLRVEERSGFATSLTRLSVGSTDLTSQIQRIFGTRHLAPFGTLYGNFCWSNDNVSATKTFLMSGFGEIGTTTSKVTAAYSGAPAAPGSFSLSRTSVLFSAPASSAKTLTAAIDVALAGGVSTWTVGTLPSNATTRWLTVTPAGGGEGPGRVTVQASPAGLSNGVYRAYLTFQAQNAFPQAINIPVTLVVGASNALTISSVVNAGSAGATGAPGAQMRVYGFNLAPSAQQSGRPPLALTLAGVSATVNGVSAPLHAVAPEQITLQIPYETPPGMAVVAINNNGQIAWQEFPVATAAPGIFTDSGGYLAPSSTAAAGQTATLFLTGEGDVTPGLATGATPAFGTPVRSLPVPGLPVKVTVAGADAKVVFAAIPAGLVGVTQINFVVPSDAPAGVQPVVVTVGEAASPAARLNVTAAASEVR
ncbi:MAG TPA: protease pro-enzyme activation domain-containing protein [Bryobacteraceae bacterium]|nr:protease pro-enzyme activation domain-containing protein [Bryobacteraceae bacterium]